MPDLLYMEQQDARDDILLRRAELFLASETAEKIGCASLYDYLRKYAVIKELKNTYAALPVVIGTAVTVAGDITNRFGFAEEQLTSLRHCLSMCKMLSDLHLPFVAYDEDVLLAAALTHILPEIKSLHDTEKLMGRYGIAHDVYDTAVLLYREENMTPAEEKQYYKCIAENPLALLIALADRGNIVEHLYNLSLINARSFIHETRNYYLPLCIYGKEHYHEILGPISILMEKMRTLAEVADILLSRFVSRESELTQEILALQEENATLTGIISSLEG